MTTVSFDHTFDINRGPVGEKEQIGEITVCVEAEVFVRRGSVELLSVEYWCDYWKRWEAYEPSEKEEEILIDEALSIADSF